MTGSTDGVQRFSSGGPWEAVIGYSRAVAAGPFVMTAGCTAVVDGVLQHQGDAGGQMRVALANAVRAVEMAGCTVADVVQSRMYLTDPAHADEVGRAHGEVFGDVRPAATMVLVAGLIDPAMLVEVELVAYRAR